MVVAAIDPFETPVAVTAGVLEYTFNFDAVDAAHVHAQVQKLGYANVDLVFGVDYTVAFAAGTDAGGTVTLTDAKATEHDGANIVLHRITPVVQETALPNQGPYFSETVEAMHDRTTMAMQEGGYANERALLAPLGSRGGSITPGAEGTVAVWDDEGNLVSGDMGAGGTPVGEGGNFPGKVVGDLAELEAIASTDLAVAAAVYVTRNQMRYVRAPSAATDAHLDLTSAGGLKYYESGLKFSSEQRLADAVTAGRVVNGDVCSVGTVGFVVDSTVPFGDCVLRDYGIAGVRALLPAHNEYFGCFFHGRHKGAVTFSGSYDGVNFAPLNFEALPAIGTGNETLGGRDPSIVPYRGKWYVLFTGSDEATHDFRMGVSDDLLTWNEYYMSLGATIKTSATVPLAGGTYPAINIWGPELVYNPTDRAPYVMLSVVYDGQLTDDYGNTINNRRPFYATFDPETRTVGEPVALDMGGGEDLTSLIGHAPYTDENDVLWVAMKDDVTKKMGIWKSDGGIAGTFTKQLDILSDISQEGYSWVKHFYYDESGDRQYKLRIYIDQNRMGPAQAYANDFAEIPWYIEADAPEGPWSAPQRAYVGTPVRHGTVLNMAHNVSPRFMHDVERLRALFGANPRKNLPEGDELADGARAIRPRNDFVYYVDGVGVSSDLTIMDGSADRFYLAAFGGDAGTGINVVHEAAGVSNTPDAAYAVGFGTSDALVEFRRGPGGLYYPASTVGTAGVVPAASETVAGKMAIATIADIRAGGLGPNNEAIVPAKMRSVPRYNPDPEADGPIELTDKVWMLDVSTQEMRWFNVGDLLSGSGSGLANWGEAGTALTPNADGQAVGDATKRVREIVFQPRTTAGAAGSNDDTALFMTQAGHLRIGTAAEAANSLGADVNAYRYRDMTGTTGGTVVWDKRQGSGFNFTTTLTSALTIDLSATAIIDDDDEFKHAEEIRIRVSNPGSQTISFTLPSGSIEWIGGSVVPGTTTLYYVLQRVGNSNLSGVAAEVKA